jgi:hypothetical protein
MNCRFLTTATVTLVAMSLTGCGVGRAITSPFHSSSEAPSTNTSDVTHPGRPLPVPTPTPRVASRKSNHRVGSPTPKPSASKSNSLPSGAAQFPVAKPVPGKPGMVFNPFKANGGYIDVSGYARGSKVKDPESQKIFIVP